MVFFIFLQEIQWNGECTQLFIRGGSQEIFIFRFPHHSYKLSRFALQGFGPVTVRIKIPEELEGRMPFIVLNHIRSHLQRRINDNPIGYLLCQGGIHTAVSFIQVIPLLAAWGIACLFIKNIKSTRCIIHRTAQQAGKRQ